METFIVRTSAILLLYVLLQWSKPVNPYITRTETHHSSVFQTVYDHALLANSFRTQVAVDFLICAQHCLANSSCMSVNFIRLPNNKGLCELNTDYVDGRLYESVFLFYKKGSVFGQLINVSNPVFPPEIEKPRNQEFNFTTLGASGPSGPTNTSKYVGTNLEGKVLLNNGIQLWTIPQTGNYIIEAFGASGSNGTCHNCTWKEWRVGGLGAIMKGTFYLNNGTKLKILVGHEGSLTEKLIGKKAGGGGGGTFVVLDDDTPLIIAGGGGGGGQPKLGGLDGGPGLVGEDGGVCGGSAGNGGRQCDEMGEPKASLTGGCGAGFKTNGVGFGPWPGSYSFVDIAKGGKQASDVQLRSFGGGGFGMQYPGGGGGYSGGGLKKSSGESGEAGGGGSYNNGTNAINKEGANKGDGKVSITYL